MLSYALRRTLWSLPLLLGVATLVFIAVNLSPRSPADLFINPSMSAETKAQIEENLGLNDPLPVQYGMWLVSLIRGDLQYSYTNAVPVKDLIRTALPNTLVLAFGALFLSFLLAIFIGVVQAARQHSLLDSVLSGVTLFFYSVPSFWLGYMLVLLFSGTLLDLPASAASGVNSEFLGFWGQIWDRFLHLLLPLVTLTLVLTGGIARYVRTSMLEVIRQDYMRTARAKGVSEFSVVFKHGLRNALIPVVTLFGMYFPLLLSGTVLVEEVFAWPGMGRLLVESVLNGDHPVVLAVTLLFAGGVIAGNLIADLLYGIVDPRIREGNV